MNIKRGVSVKLEETKNFLLYKIKHAELMLLGPFSSPYFYFLPKQIFIELTTRCNLNCAWCFRDGIFIKKNTDVDFLKLKEFIRTFHDFQEIYFVGAGEPLLYEKLEDLISFSKKYVSKVVVVTNGTLITKNKADSLSKSGLDMISISIDTLDKALFFEMKKFPLSKMLKNIKNIEKSKITTEISIVVCKENIDSIIHFPEFFSNFKIKQFSLRHLNEHENSRFERLPFNDRNLKKFVITFNNNCKKFKSKSNVVSLLHPMYITSVCKFSLLYPFIDSSGYMNLCCFRRSSSLNIYGKTFKEVWNNRNLQLERNKLINRNYDTVCKRICFLENIIEKKQGEK